MVFLLCFFFGAINSLTEGIVVISDAPLYCVNTDTGVILIVVEIDKMGGLEVDGDKISSSFLFFAQMTLL